jgi:hypothetical protein
MKIIKNLSLGLILAGLVSACGARPQFADRFDGYSNSWGTSESGQYMSADLQCSENPNITGTSGAVSQEYRACRSEPASTTIRIFPADGSLRTVCVFPTLGGRGIVANPYGTVYTRYAVQCTNVGAEGVSIAFGSIQFDGIQVVRATDAGTLSFCLAHSNVSACTSQYSLQNATGAL